MKALLILCDNVYLTPFIRLYENALNTAGINYDIVFWDKNNSERISEGNYIRFYYGHLSIRDKIYGYWRFRKKIIKLLKKEQYDFIIPLGTFSACLIWHKLVSKYRGRFILDIRDYSFERYAFFRYIERRLTEASGLNVISSEGYKCFLPKADYRISHNLPDIKRCEAFKQLSNKNNFPICLSFIGFIRFMEQNKKIIDFFKNDDRFLVRFIGTGALQLVDYCKEISNVVLIDTFDPSQTLEFYKDTDFVMNMYGNNNPLVDYLLSNKLYYAAILYKPILVCKDTFMENVASSYHFGFVMELKSSDEKDKLVEYYLNINREKLIKDCNSFIEKAISEQNELENALCNLLKETKNRKGIKGI